MYISDVIAFFFAGRFNWDPQDVSGTLSDDVTHIVSRETVEKLEWAALL
jgi:sugar (pentulose or hexulose) kinase